MTTVINVKNPTVLLLVNWLFKFLNSLKNEGMTHFDELKFSLNIL